ncbi:MAG: hypothetical protein RLY71_1737 [Pseudomonadota bacterium]|jgi:5-methylcytosine-specific restriction endonuclease McrA
MISYPISRARLEQLIEQEKPGWLQRANNRTAIFAKDEKYEETSSIWSEIKSVYMRLQGESKCAFCERKLEYEFYGNIEQDVEHFRPKKRVKKWAPSETLHQLGIRVQSPPETGGYFLLAYDIFNYSAACKPCNSTIKSDYFPVIGSHQLNGARPEDLLSEQPLLIYPIGDFDTPPDRLIGFYGIAPKALHDSGHDQHRALATIEFFGLDDFNRRKNLARERATIIVALFPQLENLMHSTDAKHKRSARTIIQSYTQPKAPHANCARSFVELHSSDQSSAAQIFDDAVKYLDTIS